MISLSRQKSAWAYDYHEDRFFGSDKVAVGVIAVDEFCKFFQGLVVIEC